MKRTNLLALLFAAALLAGCKHSQDAAPPPSNEMPLATQNPPAMPKGAWFTAHLQGRKYFVTVAGNKPWEISIIDLKGRVIAVRDVQGGSSCVVAERLAPGVYCVKFTYDKAVSWKRSIAVQ